MALGALGESASAVTALGFGSAAILGGAYLLSSQPREKAYMQGAEALECLKGTMQPFDVEQGNLTLGQLCRFDSELKNKKEELQRQITDFAGNLASYRAEPDGIPDSVAKKKLCYGEKLLKAANASLQAANKAYDSSTKYYNYSYDNSGYEMVITVNSINNKVSTAMITTEPDLHALANNLSSVIPESAQKLAGIDKNAAASKTAVEKAAVEFSKVPTAAPSVTARSNVVPGLDRLAQDLYSRINETNNAAEEVVNRTPSDILPKAKDCMKVFKESGAPPDVLTLNPAGDISLNPGENKTVTISGGKLPYEVRWLCDCYNSGVTAQTAYQDTTATIVIAASDSAHVGTTYPLMITDATGIGSPINVVVVSKKADNSETPDCPSVEESTNASLADVKTMAELAASVHAYAVAAAEAKTAADKAVKAHKANDASDAAAKAYAAAAQAQSLAAQAKASAKGSKDPIIQNLAQSARAESQKAAKSAAEAAADAARASASSQTGS